MYMGMLIMSVVRSRGVSAVQRFLMYSINGDSIGTLVSVRYRAGVRNSGMSIKRGSTVMGKYAGAKFREFTEQL